MAYQQLIKKPKDVTYTQMSIWLDANFYKEDCDLNTAYVYLWCLAYMLACKRRYFNDVKDYEGFASFMAYDVFARRQSVRANTTKLKSSLNYMKSVLSFRKIKYEEQRHQEIMGTDYDNFDSDRYIEMCRSTLEKANHHRTEELMYELLEKTPAIIKKNIPSMFKQDKAIYNNIYISCLLSMLNRIIFIRKKKVYFDDQIQNADIFNELKYYKNNIDKDIIIWHLDESYRTAVQVTMNKADNYIVKEIREIVSENMLTKNEFDDIMNSGYIGGLSEAVN